MEHGTAALRSVSLTYATAKRQTISKSPSVWNTIEPDNKKDKTMKHYSMLPVFIGMLAVAAIGAVPVIAEERPSDNTITYWVKEALRDDPRIVASDIKVETNEGVVTLSGSSRSVTGKKYADMETKKIKGVMGVINKLDVKPEFRYDWDIAQDIRHRLVNSAFIRSHFLGVTVSNGRADLDGRGELLGGETMGGSPRW